LPTRRAPCSICSPDRAIPAQRSGEDDTHYRAHRRRTRRALRRLDRSRSVSGPEDDWQRLSRPIPFPDPSPATPPDEVTFHQPPRRRAATPGAGSSVGDRFWLTETVESGRLSHAFGFTLLGERGGTLRHADLLAPEQLKAEAASGADGAPLALINRGDARGELGSTFGEPSYVGIAGGRYLLVATRPIARLIAFDLVAWSPACSVASPLNAADIDHLSITARMADNWRRSTRTAGSRFTPAPTDATCSVASSPTTNSS
jgi:hypothetical protein